MFHPLEYAMVGPISFINTFWSPSITRIYDVIVRFAWRRQAILGSRTLKVSEIYPSITNFTLDILRKISKWSTLLTLEYP